MDVRRIVTFRDVAYADAFGRPTAPITRVAAAAC